MRSAKIPPFFPQDLKHFSKIHGFTYAIVWQPIYGGGTDRDGCFIMQKGKPLPEKLKVYMLKSFGGFASASRTHHFLEGQTIAGLAFDRRDWAYVPDMQACAQRVRCACACACMRACARADASFNGYAHLSRACLMLAWQSSSPNDEQRQSIAKEHNVKGCFAFFRDGCVYEFGGEDEISEEKVAGLLKQFGGTRGPKPEEEELAAKPQRPAWKRQSSVAVMQVPAAS
jgi:hypothetical protein